MKGKLELLPLLVLLVMSALFNISCGGGAGATPESSSATQTATQPVIRTVTLSWNANRETAVNTTGGGYKLYYSTTSGFDITDVGVSVIDVPFVAPPVTPTNVSIDLLSGRYYFRVVAYSTLTAPWNSGGSMSAPSAQISILVP